MQIERSLWLRALPALGLGPEERVLAVGMAGNAALPGLRAAGVPVTSCDWHVAALARGRPDGAPPGVSIAWDGAPPLPGPGPWDVGLADLAGLAGREAFALALGLCARRVRPGGRVLVCGGNTDGVGGAARRLAEWFGAATPIAYGGGRRILQAPVPAPVRGEVRVPLPGLGEPVGVRLAGAALRLHPAPGVFARGLPERGARLLAEAATADGAVVGRSLCDVGCGAGAVGLAALRRGAAHCRFVDENLLALRALRENLRLNGLEGRAEAIAADAASGVPGPPAALVVCNPPFHAGPRADLSLGQALVRAAWAATAPGGRLLVVCQRFLRYEADVPTLREVGGDGPFRVLAAVRRDGAAGRGGGA